MNDTKQNKNKKKKRKEERNIFLVVKFIHMIKIYSFSLIYFYSLHFHANTIDSNMIQCSVLNEIKLVL